MMLSTMLSPSCIRIPGDGLGVGPSSRHAASPARSSAWRQFRPFLPCRPARFPCPTVASTSDAPGSTAFKVNVQGRHITLTPSLKQHAESKVIKALQKYDNAVKEVDIKLSVGGRGKEAHHQRQQTAEVTVRTLRHGVVRVEDTEDDLHAAVDLVVDKLRRKMSKLKGKALARSDWPGRGGGKGGPSLSDVLPEDGDEAAETLDLNAEPPVLPEIVREKIVFMEKLLTVSEAVVQMEQVGHDFYVFQDSADRMLKIVYRRKSEGYGVLLPQTQ
uniref:Sigma 54 modulation/S30EA ribosomal protein C-terminal domain-containing protein n=1 Tax=Auxenochlorella protothecoides TaxID=3075 RepID=A0A1D2A6K2_AUXPR